MGSLICDIGWLVLYFTTSATDDDFKKMMAAFKKMAAAPTTYWTGGTAAVAVYTAMSGAYIYSTYEAIPGNGTGFDFHEHSPDGKRITRWTREQAVEFLRKEESAKYFGDQKSDELFHKEWDANAKDETQDMDKTDEKVKLVEGKTVPHNNTA